jgi:hypothetical protein
MRYCTKCGHMVHESARACPQCGAPQYGPDVYPEEVSSRSRLIALLLCFFLGAFGIHRFYVGKIGTGIIWLLTVGVLGIGVLVDLILIAAGAFRDGDGLLVLDWDARG